MQLTQPGEAIAHHKIQRSAAGKFAAYVSPSKPEIRLIGIDENGVECTIDSQE